MFPGMPSSIAELPLRIGKWELSPMIRDYLNIVQRNIAKDSEGREAAHLIVPAPSKIFRALELTPPDKVKVIILGQDPYPNPAQATGLAFGVPDKTKTLPGSLINIIYEAHGHKFNSLLDFFDFDVSLESWARQGVLLLNTCLTTEAGERGGHEKAGWQPFTEGLLADLAFLRREQPLIIMLWGKKAEPHEKLFYGDRHLVLKAPHPSPLSAHGGFFGCRHFEIANNYLQSNGMGPIDWTKGKKE